MSVEEPNILRRIKSIEERLDKLEERISFIENRLGPFSPHPTPQPGPIPPSRPPGPPGPPLDPFRFNKGKKLTK